MKNDNVVSLKEWRNTHSFVEPTNRTTAKQRRPDHYDTSDILDILGINSELDEDPTVEYGAAVDKQVMAFQTHAIKLIRDIGGSLNDPEVKRNMLVLSLIFQSQLDHLGGMDNEIYYLFSHIASQTFLALE